MVKDRARLWFQSCYPWYKVDLVVYLFVDHAAGKTKLWPCQESKGRPKRGPRGARQADGLAAIFFALGTDAAAAVRLG